MFSFIKWLENFMEKFKKNKGLMFTTISILSVVGIFLSLYFVNYLVQDVAHKTYENQKSNYTKTLNQYISMEKDFILSIATTTSLDSKLIEIYRHDDNIKEENNETNITVKPYSKSEEFQKIAKKYSTSLNKNLDRNDIEIYFYEKPDNTSKDIINGLNIEKTGAYFITKMPFAQLNNKYLLITAKTSIYHLKRIYQNQDKEFIFLLNNASSNRIDSLYLKKFYSKITPNFIIKKSIYNSKTVKSLKNIDFDTLIKQGYLKTKKDFYIGSHIYDYNGNEIGYALIKEEINKNNLAKLVKQLVNNVTMIALGLIVSMILFLF